MNSDKKDTATTIEENAVVVHAYDERSDEVVERAVNRGIAAAVLESVPKALKIMSEAGVPRHISLRVLSSKARRRASDWK